MKILVVVDMQKDFIDGSLGTKEAAAIVEPIAKKIREYREQGIKIIFTRDTHSKNYLETLEGKNLPVEHCIEGTEGFEIDKSLDTKDSVILNKITFGSVDLPEIIRKIAGGNSNTGELEIELCGLCTDICVISNAMILKAFFPEAVISVDAGCCAGVTPESHVNAINAMKMCQIKIYENELCNRNHAKKADKNTGAAVNDEKEFLKTYNQKKYDCPSVAADMVVFSIRENRPESYRVLGEKKLSVLLIRRGAHPYMNCWAIPGGFVKRNETVEQAAYRELKEETGIQNVMLRQLQVFSRPDRDKRGWVMSSAFMALAKSEELHIISGDDAADAKWFEVELKETGTEELDKTDEKNRKKIQEEWKSGKIRLYKLVLRMEQEKEEKEAVTALILLKNSDVIPGAEDIQILWSRGIAFDHAAIMTLAVIRLREELIGSGLAFALMPDEFTLTELQRVYETVLQEKYTAANFRRKMESYLEETGNMSGGAGHRPAMLFRKKL